MALHIYFCFISACFTRNTSKLINCNNINVFKNSYLFWEIRIKAVMGVYIKKPVFLN